MRCRGACARYADTLGSPSSQNRHGTSAARAIPTRGPLIILAERSVVRALGHRMRSGEPATHTSAPSSDRSMPSAWQSRAGPRVGIAHAAEVPWRFWLDGEPSVSAYRAYAPKRRKPVTP